MEEYSSVRLRSKLLSSSRQERQNMRRSGDSSLKPLFSSIVSRTASANQVLRSGDASITRLSHQQFSSALADHCTTLQVSLANRTVLQMDQTASTHQNILRHLRERCAHAKMDLCLRLGGYSQETIQARTSSLHNHTDSERFPVRENFNRSSTCEYRAAKLDVLSH